MKLKANPYTYSCEILSIENPMSKLRAAKAYSKNGEMFGKRLARLRDQAGYSQRDLAAETGISNRVIAYYEGQTDYTPAHLLPVFARSLGVTIEQLLGIEKIKEDRQIKDTRLWRRFKAVQKLPPARRKQIVQYLDTFIQNEKLTQSR